MACGYVSIQVSMLFGRFEGGAISHGLSRDKGDDWTLFVELLVFHQADLGQLPY